LITQMGWQSICSSSRTYGGIVKNESALRDWHYVKTEHLDLSVLTNDLYETTTALFNWQELYMHNWIKRMDAVIEAAK